MGGRETTPPPLQPSDAQQRARSGRRRREESGVGGGCRGTGGGSPQLRAGVPVAAHHLRQRATFSRYRGGRLLHLSPSPAWLPATKGRSRRIHSTNIHAHHFPHGVWLPRKPREMASERRPWCDGPQAPPNSLEWDLDSVHQLKDKVEFCHLCSRQSLNWLKEKLPGVCLSDLSSALLVMGEG